MKSKIIFGAAFMRAIAVKAGIGVGTVGILADAPASGQIDVQSIAWVIGGIAAILLLVYILSKAVKGGDAPKDDDPFLGGGN